VQPTPQETNLEATERDEAIFTERVLKGATLEEVGELLDITTQRVHQVARRLIREHIDFIELNLLVAKKEGSLLALAIPDAAEDDQNLAISYLHFVLKALAMREIDVEVHYRPLPGGQIAFLLEDVTKNGGMQ
jgi:hypothetical protein